MAGLEIPGMKTGEGNLYLCMIVDLFSKLVVGWSMPHRQDRQMVIRAVEMAAWQRQGDSQVIRPWQLISQHWIATIFKAELVDLLY